MWKLLVKIAELIVSILPRIFPKSTPKPALAPPKPSPEDLELDALITCLEELVAKNAEVAEPPPPSPKVLRKHELLMVALDELIAEEEVDVPPPKFLDIRSQIAKGPLKTGQVGVTAREPTFVTRIVLHCTQGPSWALDRLWSTLRGGRRSPSGKPMYLGYHIVVPANGDLVQLVAGDIFDTRVQHATAWNATTIGVAFMGTPESLTEEQKAVAPKLVRYLLKRMRKNGVGYPSVVGHDEVDPYKRADPGWEFMQHVRKTLDIKLSPLDEAGLVADRVHTKKIKDAQRKG